MYEAHWRLHVSNVYLNFLCYHIREITSYSSVFFHAWCLDICTVQITSLSKGGNVQYTRHAFCLHENVYTKNYMLKTACYKYMLKIRLCGCYMFFNQAGKSISLRQRWHGLTFFNPDLPRLPHQIWRIQSVYAEKMKLARVNCFFIALASRC